MRNRIFNLCSDRATMIAFNKTRGGQVVIQDKPRVITERLLQRWLDYSCCVCPECRAQFAFVTAMGGLHGQPVCPACLSNVFTPERWLAARVVYFGTGDISAFVGALHDAG